MEAINREDVQVVEFLLKNGADPNLDDLNITRFVPQSLLMIACKTGNLRIVQLLIQYGAYINIPTDVRSPSLPSLHLLISLSLSLSLSVEWKHCAHSSSRS